MLDYGNPQEKDDERLGTVCLLDFLTSKWREQKLDILWHDGICRIDITIKTDYWNYNLVEE